MFAYCGNNPVCRLDPSGDRWISIGDLITALCVASVVGLAYRLSISKKNYKHNSAIDLNPSTSTKNKLINDQNGATGNNFVYGNYSASWNACETIAIHNAKVLLGRTSSLSETMRDCQNAGIMIGNGYFGSNPLAIGKVLKKYGISYSSVKLNGMTRPGIYIISFWNDGAPWNGLHTVAVAYDGSQYTTYNLKGNGYISHANPAEYAQDYICGYYLGG